MSFTFDVNILVYAADTRAARHERARQFLEWVATTPSIAYVFWPTLVGYVRIATHPGILESPLTTEEALADVEDLIARPQINAVGEGDAFWSTFRAAARMVGARGNLVSGAHLAALMHQHGVWTIWTADRDFRKFDGITALDPFHERYSAGFG